MKAKYSVQYMIKEDGFLVDRISRFTNSFDVDSFLKRIKMVSVGKPTIVIQKASGNEKRRQVGGSDR